MIIPKTKFLVERIGGMQFTKDRKHRFIELVLRKPAHTNAFDEKVGTDDLIQCRAWNKKAEDMPIISKGDKVEVSLQLNASEVLNSNKSGFFYNYNFSVFSIEIL